MHRPLIAGLLTLLAAAPAAASPSTYNFSFSGSAYGAAPNGALAMGSITFEQSLLANPGRSVYDPGNSLQGAYGTPTLNLVTALSVLVTGSTNGNGTWGLSDFDAVVFDSSLRPLDLTRELVGQATASLIGKTGGQDDPNPFASFVQSYTGDFQLFAKAGSAAPTGIYPFQLGTNGGNDDPLQLISFAPAEGVAEVSAPGSWALMILGLGLAGAARTQLSRACPCG